MHTACRHHTNMSGTAMAAWAPEICLSRMVHSLRPAPDTRSGVLICAAVTFATAPEKEVSPARDADSTRQGVAHKSWHDRAPVPRTTFRTRGLATWSRTKDWRKQVRLPYTPGKRVLTVPPVTRQSSELFLTNGLCHSSFASTCRKRMTDHLKTRSATNLPDDCQHSSNISVRVSRANLHAVLLYLISS